MVRQQSGGSGHEFFVIAPVDLSEERFAVGKVSAERSLSCTGAFGDLVEVDVVGLGKGCAARSRDAAQNRTAYIGPWERGNKEEPVDSCLRCGDCRDYPALPLDSVRLSRVGSARARAANDCVGTFQTGGWSVHAERSVWR